MCLRIRNIEQPAAFYLIISYNKYPHTESELPRRREIQPKGIMDRPSLDIHTHTHVASDRVLKQTKFR